jgi:hypothetical protein
MPTPASLHALLDATKDDVALFVGNGINRYDAPAGTNSWEGLLTQLARKHIDPDHQRIPEGISPTEFYDMLELAAERSSGSTSLQAQFCEQMNTWRPLAQHARVVRWAARWAVPLLTTNFDETLSQAAAARRRRCGKDRFTAFYPWSTCFATGEIEDPAASFAIWHVNGMQAYRQSIRLGLSHYIGSAERARGWLHKSGSRLFAAEDPRNWPGANSWLQVFFHKPLLFFGFGLGENEVFLRWLLIERAKYFRKYPARARPGWYVHVRGSSDMNVGKRLFLERVGIHACEVAAYADLYEAATWALPDGDLGAEPSVPVPAP